VGAGDDVADAQPLDQLVGQIEVERARGAAGMVAPDVTGRSGLLDVPVAQDAGLDGEDGAAVVVEGVVFASRGLQVGDVPLGEQVVGDAPPLGAGVADAGHKAVHRRIVFAAR